jgi:hypothetical protein
MIIIILIIILLLLILLKNNSFEKIEQSFGNYMKKDELYSYLMKDEDNYYKNFSNIDLKARNINNLAEYYKKIEDACVDIDNNTALILNKCIKKANDKLRKYKCTGFDGNKCANIDWKIGLVKNNSYEEGYPHTRFNVIIIPQYLINNQNQLTSTLIHEKIHVYQKMYPEDIEQYLKSNGFTKYKLRSTFNNIINTRSNPDMDEWIYKNNNNEIMMAEYYDNPKSIMDVNIKPNNSSKYEHPFEYMAYDITSDITSDITNNINQ